MAAESPIPSPVPVSAPVSPQPPSPGFSADGNGNNYRNAPWWARWAIKQGALVTICVGILYFIAFYVVVPLVDASVKQTADEAAAKIEQSKAESDSKIRLWDTMERVFPRVQESAQAAADSAKVAMDTVRELKRSTDEIVDLEKRQAKWNVDWESRINNEHKQRAEEAHNILEKSQIEHARQQKEHERIIAIADEVLRCAKEKAKTQ